MAEVAVWSRLHEVPAGFRFGPDVEIAGPVRRHRPDAQRCPGRDQHAGGVAPAHGAERQRDGGDQCELQRHDDK